MIRAGILLVGAVLLAGCATGPRPEAEDRAAAWDALRERLEALEAWRAEGRLSVRMDGDGGQANFSWIEAADGWYRVRLAGPWGQGAARLRGGRGGVELLAGEGQRYFGRDPRRLLRSVYGWDVPVAELRRWLRGLPTEDATHDLDRFGRTERIAWRGWVIEYGRYRQVDDLELPAVLRARHAERGTELRLAIDQWRLGETGDRPAPESPIPLMGDG